MEHQVTNKVIIITVTLKHGDEAKAKEWAGAFTKNIVYDDSLHDGELDYITWKFQGEDKEKTTY